MGKNKEVQSQAALSQPMETFYPFVLSVYGMTDKEAQVLPATLSQIMAAKMDEPISHVKGWVNSRTAIAVVR